VSMCLATSRFLDADGYILRGKIRIEIAREIDKNNPLLYFHGTW